MHAIRIPSTAFGQSQGMQIQVEKAVSSFPEVAHVFSKTGTAEIATDPMPPNMSDTFIILKPQEQWPDPSLAKDALIERIQEAVARLGLSQFAVQDVIGAAIGGREAGVLFEGDRRFPIIVRLPDAVREDVEALKNLPVPLPPSPQTGRAPSILLKQVAIFSFARARTRFRARTASVGSS